MVERQASRKEAADVVWDSRADDNWFRSFRSNKLQQASYEFQFCSLKYVNLTAFLFVIHLILNLLLIFLFIFWVLTFWLSW